MRLSKPRFLTTRSLWLINLRMTTWWRLLILTIWFCRQSKKKKLKSLRRKTSIIMTTRRNSHRRSNLWAKRPINGVILSKMARRRLTKRRLKLRGSWPRSQPTLSTHLPSLSKRRRKKKRKFWKINHSQMGMRSQNSMNRMTKCTRKTLTLLNSKKNRKLSQRKFLRKPQTSSNLKSKKSTSKMSQNSVASSTTKTRTKQWLATFQKRT